MKKLFLPLIAVSLLAGCADSPEDVKATYVPDTAYASLTCQQLGEQELQLGDSLAATSDKQRSAHALDSGGVALAAVPLSGFMGLNKTDELARDKGRMDAIHRVQSEKGCPGTQSAPIPSHN